jgi:hypothetical protein
MRTNTRAIATVATLRFAMPLLVAAAVTFPAIAKGLESRGTDTSGSAPQLPLTDVTRLSDIVTFGVPPAGGIPAAQALTAAAQEYAFDETTAAISPFLETASVPGTFGTILEIRERPVWIVRCSGLAIPQPGVVTPNGSSTHDRILHTAFVFIDASTGEFLMTVWQS